MTIPLKVFSQHADKVLSAQDWSKKKFDKALAVLDGRVYIYNIGAVRLIQGQAGMAVWHALCVW